jgi:hypothetical protein
MEPGAARSTKTRSRNVRWGSNASFSPSADDFRSTPVNGRSQNRRAYPKRATNRRVAATLSCAIFRSPLDSVNSLLRASGHQRGALNR